ncbi:MAG: hypothetical protein ACKOZT_06260 [Cyanobium sp.]
MAPSSSPEGAAPAAVDADVAAGTGTAAPTMAGGGDSLDSRPEPILCQHCGRTASNGISCIGACVADSGY